MWYERYELEHVEASAEAIAERKKLIEELSEENDKTKNRIRENILVEVKDANKEQNHYATALWTGVSMTTLGVVLTSMGGIMLYRHNDDSIEFKYGGEGCDQSRTYTCELSPKTQKSNDAYWGILGAGIITTAVGATITGIFGYYYSEAKKQSRKRHRQPLSFYQVPNGIGFTF